MTGTASAGGAGRRGRPLVAWLVILAAAAGLVLAHGSRGGSDGGGTGGDGAAAPADDPVSAAVSELQTRLVVGLAAEPAGADPASESAARRRGAAVGTNDADAGGDGASPPRVASDRDEPPALDRFGPILEQLPAGSVRQRLRIAVVVAELAGPRAALERLDDLDRDLEEAARLVGFDAAPEDLAVAADLRAWFEVRAAADASDLPPPALDPARAEALEDALGWFGRLAAHPPGSATADRRALVHGARAAAGVAAFGGVAVFTAAALGAVGLVAMLILLAGGRLAGGLDDRRSVHGIYAETFAVWLLVFTLLQVATGLLPASLPPAARLAAAGLAFFASLAALAWPVLRGIPWREVRRDCGLDFGRGGPLEPLWGVPGYAMALPILGGGVLLVLLLMRWQAAGAARAETPFAPTGGPAHPVVAALLAGDPAVIAAVLFLGSVAAPIVEEIFFRGVLHRHLRDAFRGGGAVASVLGAAVVGGVLFAAIHPQGLVAIPALAALAIAMTLLREWRVSVVPSIVLHGISNGLVLGMIAAMGAAGSGG